VKLAWRFLRGTIYAAFSSWVGSVAAAHGIDPTTVTGLGTGLLMAIDKLLGIGAAVKDKSAPAK
jgi:hypothetical protein